MLHYYKITALLRAPSLVVMYMTTLLRYYITTTLPQPVSCSSCAPSLWLPLPTREFDCPLRRPLHLVCVHVCGCVCACACVSACVCVCMYISMYYVHTYLAYSTYIYAYIVYMHIYICLYIYIDRETPKRKGSRLYES
jgi:hypothetical protein